MSEGWANYTTSYKYRTKFATLTMRFMMKRLVLTFAILAVDISLCQSPATPAEPEASTVEPGTFYVYIYLTLISLDAISKQRRILCVSYVD